MAPTSKLEIFQYTPETINDVRKYFNTDENQIKQNIEVLKNWLKQQQHLPQNADDDFLERMLLRNKFRIEKTKEKLDAYYTVRGLYFQKYFKDENKIVPSKENSKLLVLPKLTKLNERIVCFSKTKDFTDDALRQIYFMSQICELCLYNDYSIGDHWIFDAKNFTINDVTMWTASRVSQFWKLYMKAYSGRLLSLCVINAPSFIPKFINFLKMVLPEKIASRFRVCNNLNELYEILPKDVLPSDLGGNLGTIEEIAKKMDVIFEQQQSFFEEISKNISNEKLRIGELPYSDLFGTEGSFKKLEID